MKTWDRGRKRATPEQKRASEQWQKERVKIINLVARKPEIQKICVICGQPAKILHNKKAPYYITFICDECKKDPSKLAIAEESRFDVREKINKYNLSVKTFNDSEITRLVLDYMNNSTLLSLGDYCDKVGISRHQFNQVIERYDIVYPKQHIKDIINNKVKMIQKQKLKKVHDADNLI